MGFLSRLRRVGMRLLSLPVRIPTSRDRAAMIEEMAEGMVHRVRIRGGELAFHVPGALLYDRAAGMLSKEPDTLRWLDAMAAGDVLWDIGANVGVFSLYAAARARCRVLAFEPSAANFHFLARNLQLNAGLRVDAYCVALAGRTGLGAMNLATPAAGMAMAQFGKPGEASPYWDGPVSATHGMVGFTIDDFVARFEPPFPTHVKIDVDGLEPDILEGAAATLADARVRSVMAEVSLTDEQARGRSLAALEKAGFALLSRGEEQGGGAERAANHFFGRR